MCEMLAKRLESLDSSVYEVGVDFSLGFGWGWFIELTDQPEAGSAMGFVPTLQEALEDLVRTLEAKGAIPRQ